MLRKICYFIFVFCLLAALKTTFVSAQAKYSIKEMTPAVTQALENRKARYEELKGLKAKGTVGENNQGYVEVLVSDEAANVLADAENLDRKTIYVTIAEQNDLTNALGTIESVFAQVQRDKAEAGEKIQDESGTWGTK
ncbi:MAG TPA: hypothetical protein DD723_00365 [Candidatus Omnitrophica bacterium]|nr:MAG: hypothetical protein A2Z81_04635 [Omnitrophica WOR_2 bacterium GWA2_45_18]OGX19184.1 MAG: hypothetical protein A2Y04_04500 [Omnitrophica WOR_2 bacterium GWC2_45_7]HBR13984.1 hypothetical protein [Candidatus Omnitrophota bacterium]